LNASLSSSIPDLDRYTNNAIRWHYFNILYKEMNSLLDGFYPRTTKAMPTKQID